jgi:serine/threonine-protein kinase
MHRSSGAEATLIRADSLESASRLHRSWSLPPDLQADALRRLRASVLIYALAFFLAGLAPALVFQEAREVVFSNTFLWLPPVISIAGALIGFILISSRRIPDRAKLRIGLAFEVLGSLGIAAAEYQNITAPIMGTWGITGFGLSWVVTWVLLFSVMVPTPPLVAALAAGASVAMVPLTYALGVALGRNVALTPPVFFFALVFPYIVVVIMAWTASRVVYGLGTAVRRARELGSYRLERRLGVGGMGEVWLARHRLLARPAAIKLVRAEFLGGGDGRGKEIIQRFEREAQATALLRSPHTVEVYDFGTADDGSFYYVMELLDGFDLDQLVTQFGPLPPERAIHFLRQVCASLGEAHEAGLIHRDIKPANLYACRYGREVDFMKVLDFGLVTHTPGAGAKGATEATQVAGGTPAFMSPEQVLGDEKVDARSDIYAIGCVAYWLLTGTTVFSGGTSMQTMMMQVTVTPEPPSQRLGQVLPAALEEIVLACLAKEPASRPQSVDELSSRLAAVPLGQPWGREEAVRWWSTAPSSPMAL